MFHIIHQYGTEDISDAQILDEVKILNRDYNRENADTVDVVDEFKHNIGKINITFRLATIDPWGNYTNGIDRIASLQTYVGNDGSKLNPWLRSKYLNVWVVKQMTNGVAGYAFYPSAVDGVNGVKKDGVIILSEYIGSIGSSTVNTSRALTHEIGHYLNLPHTWGNTNDPGVSCGDDGIQDTPITKGHTTCSLTDGDCFPNIIENVQNYMEYALLL